MPNYKTDTSLNEKDSLYDMLNLEKTMVKVYATALTESVNKNLKKTVLTNLENCSFNNLNIFEVLKDKGFVQLEELKAKEISTKKEKFSKIQKELTK